MVEMVLVWIVSWLAPHSQKTWLPGLDTGRQMQEDQLASYQAEIATSLKCQCFFTYETLSCNSSTPSAPPPPLLRRETVENQKKTQIGSM